ncbi:MAG: FAD-binding oxidoreductase [Steroidobacteraceae bacterium]
MNASRDIAARLRERLGTDAVLTAPADIAANLIDHRRLYRGRALAVVLPRSVEQVSEILALCNEERIGVVPQGGNTSYCGGATPDASGRQLVLALRRLDRIRCVDAAGFTLVVEAGCVLEEVRRAADRAERLFPLSLGSGGSCQIGGNLSTNAGGTQVLRYGMMRDLVLGLEAVLADGRVLSSLSPLRKDNTGYDVKSLFLGSEGTLGIITAASLKLYPKVRSTATAFVAVPSVQAAVDLLGQLRDVCADLVSAFELLPRLAVDLTVRHIEGVVDPLASKAGPQPSGTGYPWHVLCELTSSGAGEPLGERLEAALGAALERGTVLDAALAQSERERAAFWRMRENVPEAQRRDGASLKHDISVPVQSLPAFVAQASEWLADHVPEGRLVAYGHVGDGNLHFNLNQAPGTEGGAFLARGPEIMRSVHDLVKAFDGSFSAEHGIGQLKVGELERYGSPVELDLMRAIKRALDPNGILNPGKVLSV